MIPFLKKFKNEHSTNDVSDNEKNILITSLLIECAKGDYDFSDQEISKIKDLIKKKLKLDQSKINLIFDKALETVEENVELYSLTKDIRDNFNKEEILEIFEYMWTVVLADGKIDDFEAALMSKLVGLFHLTGKEYQMLELLSLRKGTTLTKEMFLNHLYGGMDEPELKIIDVFICKLRKKLMQASDDENYIETVWGRGYVLRDPTELLESA